jgi:hypothetical protein
VATSTQYNPVPVLNIALQCAGLSKTVYALVTPETEAAKRGVFDAPDYYDGFREAWTGKQDQTHVEFFDTWAEWSKPVVDLDRSLFPFYYPTAGASEPLRQIIFDLAAKRKTGAPRIHFFEGEYEGYKAMAEAAGIGWVEHPRANWDTLCDYDMPASGFPSEWRGVRDGGLDLFFISAPSAIDGMVWSDFNAFLAAMPENSVVVDVTYVGAVPEASIKERFNLNAPSVRNIVFSLSKPFGLYYDRVGGVFCRDEDMGLFGNKWFKGLSGIAIGSAMMKAHNVFHFPTVYAEHQAKMAEDASTALGLDLKPADVFILATGVQTDAEITGGPYMSEYLTRAGKVRICLTPGMAKMIGMTK